MMNRKSDLAFIDLENLITLSKGDKKKVYKYLNQFLELIPERMENLRRSLQAEDRSMVRQVLHGMKPQLQFFGVPGVVEPIQRLESEYMGIPMQELNSLVKNILLILEKALDEVETVLASGFE